MLIISVDARLLILHCSLMSASLKGGDKTVINMGKYNELVWSIAVLHRECGSSGKTNTLICAWCCGFHMFAFLSPQHIICLGSPRVLCLSFIFGCSGRLMFASFIFAYLHCQGKTDGEMYSVDDTTVSFGIQYHAAQRDLYLSCIMKMCAKSNIRLEKLNANISQIFSLRK